MEYFHYLQINILKNQNNQNNQKNQGDQNNQYVSQESNNSDISNSASQNNSLSDLDDSLFTPKTYEEDSNIKIQTDASKITSITCTIKSR